MKKTLAMILILTASAAWADSGSKKATRSSTTGKKSSTAAKKDGPSTKLLDPSKLNEKAPDVFRVKFDTSSGPFAVEVHREWAPNGADRFYNLVKNGYYDEARFFRVIHGFMAQFGISGNPEIAKAWREASIKDDPVRQSNTRGMVSFAMRGRDTRTTQLFINYVDNSSLDAMGFSPFGKVVEGMEVVDKLFGEYGEGAPRGKGPDQGRVQSEGNKYLNAEFPKLDFVKTARIEK